MKYYLILIFFLTACGGGVNHDSHLSSGGTDSISGYNFSDFSGTNDLQVNNGVLSGTGMIKFNENLGVAQSDFYYSLSFSLSPDSELELITHANDLLENGITLLFKRVSNEFHLLATAEGLTINTWDAFFNSLNVQEKIELGIDVHNSEAGAAHLIFWNNTNNQELLDSASPSAGGGPGRGLGLFWGLRLKNASLYSISKGSPRAPH